MGFYQAGESEVILSEAQVEYANNELHTLQRLINAKPEIGLIRYAARQEALQMIIDLHNVEVVKKNKEVSK